MQVWESFKEAERSRTAPRMFSTNMVAFSPPALSSPPCRSTRHIFLDLPQLSPQLQEYITTTSQLGGWSSNCVQVLQ